MMDVKQLLQDVEAEARRLLADSPACHDWDHTRRVLHNAVHIAAAEGADLTVVQVAAMLHDIARPQEIADHGRTDHAALGAELSPGILKKLGVEDETFSQHVADCIRTHRYRAREAAPQSLEARVLYDADKLDSIGAIGIGRAFHFAGREGARVHNLASEALSSQSYSREDTAYREYLVKLRSLKDHFLTATGRELARQRHEFMIRFFEELNRETGQPCHRVAIALGGNIGNTEVQFQQAVALLKEGGLTDLRMAPFFRTSPVDCVPGTPDFLNSAVTGIYQGSPAELLRLTQDIEQKLGRPEQHSSRESRTIDLDILLFDDKQISLPNLQIPHPRMRQRAFVLLPLAEIAPDWPVPPDGKSVKQLKAELEFF